MSLSSVSPGERRLVDKAAIDQSIQTLQERKNTWAHLPASRKVEYLDSIIRGYARNAARQVEAGNRAKGIAEGSPLTGEEWAHPYFVVRLLRQLRDTLSRIASRGRLEFPKSALRTRPDGQLAARVFPLTAIDRLLYPGFRGEVWMERGITGENLSANMAGFYRQQATGKVALVMGAGNVASIGPADLAQKLFAEGQACLFKHNPVNEYLAPFLEDAFADLIRDGFVRMATGGAEVGEYLCQHSGIDEIHLTGSDRTYEAIVFGTGDEGRERKQAGRPRLAKRFTCELGCVTPVIVAPGRWSASDIQFQAENIATEMTNNCGFNCLAAKVLVLPKNWPQARDLLDCLRAVLAAAPQRRAYYPGAEERYERVIAANPTAEPIGPRSAGVLPYTLVPGLDPADHDNLCFASECFMPLLAQTSLPGGSAAEFLHNAVEFANNTLWGTLSGSLLIQPEVARSLGSALEEAVAAMRYGTVGVNPWPAIGYIWGTTTWGAYPGHTAQDIQSGVGAVHNSFLFDKPEKSVIYGPFRMWPKPPWFITSRNMNRIFPQMFELELGPSLLRTLGIALTALRG
jgi:acyl-CoA reductase-like NAD-dependent aldehyde dehydrogenase